MVDLGTDIASHGKLSSNGQIALVSGLDNLHQAIKNRIKTYKGTYYYIDEDYGTNLKEFLGYDDNNEMRAIICLDIETSVIQDSRIKDAECYYENGVFKLKITTVNGDEIIEDDLL